MKTKNHKIIFSGEYIHGNDYETLYNIFKPLIVNRDFGICASSPPCIQVHVYEGNKQSLQNAIKRYHEHYNKPTNEPKLTVEELFAHEIPKTGTFFQTC